MTLPARPVTELPRTVPIGLARKTLRSVQRVRSHFVFGMLLLLFVALLARLAKVQLFGGTAYRGLVAEQYNVDRVTPLRGAVLDREGRVLALSRPVRNVGVEAGGVIGKDDRVCLVVDDVGRFAATLSDLLEGTPSAAAIRQAVERRRTTAFSRSGSAIVSLRRGVDDPRIVERLDAVRQKLHGLVVTHADRRDYPNGSWAGHVVGVARAPDADRPPVGLEGVEAGLEPWLCGTTVRRRVPRDGRGRAFVTPKTVDARDDADGRTAWLSIDLVVQGFCEEALDELMAAWRPRGAVALVLDPATGDVLGCAQRPGFDPASSTAIADVDLAIQWRTEVGSTFKPVTAARALERGVVTAQETFMLPREREFQFGRKSRRVRDAHEGESHGPGTLVDVLAHSNNPDTADLAYRLGQAEMTRLLKDLEVERRLPVIGLPETREGTGFVNWKRAGAADHLAWSFGHAFTMTPLRLASIFCAFAREDFRVVRPRHVLAVGGEVGPEPATGLCLAMNPAHRATVRAGLRACVTEGTGRRHVASPIYAIAGKTGTAKKSVGEGEYYSSSFVGYAPAERPRIVVLVMAQEPRVREDGVRPYGGAVAGPAVRRIVERTLWEYLGLPPSPGHALPAGVVEQAAVADPRPGPTRGPSLASGTADGGTGGAR